MEGLFVEVTFDQFQALQLTKNPGDLFLPGCVVARLAEQRDLGAKLLECPATLTNGAQNGGWQFAQEVGFTRVGIEQASVDFPGCPLQTRRRDGRP